MTPDTVNPELLLACAKLAFPEKMVMTDVFGNIRTYTPGPTPGSRRDIEEFNPLTSDADAWTLCEILERRGIIFKCIWTPSRDYYCWHYQNGDMGHGGFETKQEAMLACLSSLTSIPLYLSHIKEKNSG
jgi:hypothetical protein